VSIAFRYRAATDRGDVVEGVVRAPDERGAMDELRRQTLVPVSVELESAPAVRKSWESREDDVATSIRTLASLLAGGATLERALDFALTHARHRDVASALSAVRSAVLGGSTFADAAGARPDVFGGLASSMIRAGEESGRLDASLARLADHLDRSRAMRSQLRSALLYPLLMGVVSAVGLAVLLGFVVPRFVGMLAEVGGELPWSTRALVAASAAFTNWWWLLLLIGALVVTGLRQWARTPEGKLTYHRARLNSRLGGGLEQMVWTARFTRALGVLLDSDSRLLTALRIAREGVGNESMRAGLDRAAQGVERGERLASSLHGVLPPLAVQLLAVGEESGTLGAMAGRVADTFDADVQRRLATLVALVEPVLIVSFGAFVGFIALAMLQAIYSINASVL
jgi:type II secretory pathway component PulF